MALGFLHQQNGRRSWWSSAKMELSSFPMYRILVGRSRGDGRKKHLTRLRMAPGIERVRRIGWKCWRPPEPSLAVVTTYSPPRPPDRQTSHYWRYRYRITRCRSDARIRGLATWPFTSSDPEGTKYPVLCRHPASVLDQSVPGDAQNSTLMLQPSHPCATTPHPNSLLSGLLEV